MIPSDANALAAFARGLLVADWANSAGCLRFSTELQSDDVRLASFFQNTRSLLTALNEAGGASLTATGNLNRAFVAHLFQTMSLSKPFRESICRYSKVLNERDLWPIHIVRVVAECAGLVARRCKKFCVTKAGRELLQDQQAGALYRKIFLAYFRKFDLRYDFHLRDIPGIQETMAFILWRLDSVAHDWIPVKGLAPQVLIPGVLDQLHSVMVSEFDTEEWILAGYVLNPLRDLGLLENRGRSDWPTVGGEDTIRTTALWRKFIRFDFQSGFLANARN